MKLTITIKIQQKSYDIQVPDSQKIMETLQILNDNLDFFCMDSIPEYVQEMDSGRKISTRCTYEREVNFYYRCGECWMHCHSSHCMGIE